MATTSLVLADDHPIVLRGLNELFRSEVGFEVLAACHDGEEALTAVRTFRPDVLVLDLRLPGKDGLAVLHALQSDDLPTRTVLLTAHLDEHAVAEAMRLGAAGIVLKDSSPSVLVECVRRVRSGGLWFDADLLAATLQHTLRRDDGFRQASAELTQRELEIVCMVAEGLRNKEIAERLGVSEGTVKIHLHNVYTKLELDGRVELVRYAQRLHLV